MRRVCLVFVILAVFYKSGVFAQEFIVDGIKYNVTSVENRTVEVISNGMNGWKGKYSGDIVIPSTVNYDDKDYNVTKVGERAFWFCADVTSFVIPNTITRIENEAFAYCWNAGDIQVPENVKYIGDRAFYVCSGIRNIRIPMTVTHIGEDAFALFSQNDSVVEDYYIETIQWNCNLDFSCLGKSFIGDCNNVRDYNVRKLIIGKDVTKFTFCDNPYDDPFYESRGTLKKVESIEVNELNPVFDSRDGCNAIINTSQNKLIAGINNTVIPATVTRIGEFAFMDCDAITSIDIPSGVTNIDDGAFCGCSALESFTIPSGVTTIGYRAFLNCGKLETITIPASLTGIGSSAFEGCSSLITEISIPADMTVVPSAAFRGCSSLTSVTIPSSVTRIENDAFYGCESLTDITIPEGVTDIRYDAFSGCKKISSLYIPSSVSSISIGAFNYCDALESIVVAAGNTTYDSRNSCNSIIKISTNELIVGSSKSVVPSGVTSISNYAFSGRIGLEELELPNSVTSIGLETFKGCVNLERINMPANVEAIGDRAFDGCESLVSFEWPESVTSIGYSMFEGCHALKSIIIPNTVTSIGSNAFSNSGLTSITIPSGVTYISDSFSECEDILSIIVEEGVENIGGRAFYGCINVKTISVPSTVTIIADDAFGLIFDLDSVYWNSNSTGLFNGSASYSQDRHIDKLVIGKSVTTIELSGFWGGGINHFEVEADNPVFDSRDGCDGIIVTASNVLYQGCINTKIPYGVTAIGATALDDIYDMTSLQIPSSVASIGWCGLFRNSSLLSINMYSKTPPLLEDPYTAIRGKAPGGKIYVFSDLVETYKNASGWKDYYVYDIEAIPDLTANNAGGELGNWCTYYNGLADVRMPDDVEIYKAYVDGDRVVLTEIAGHVVKRGEGVLLKSANSSITLLSAPNEFDGDYSDNALKGVDYVTAQEEGKTYYVLSKKGDAFGFYKLNPEVSLGANKAYLTVENAHHAPMRSFYSLDLNNGTETAVGIPIVEGNDDWFSIYGVKLSGEPTQNGLYIHNGKKVFINDKSVF